MNLFLVLSLLEIFLVIGVTILITYPIDSNESIVCLFSKFDKNYKGFLEILFSQMSQLNNNRTSSLCNLPIWKFFVTQLLIRKKWFNGKILYFLIPYYKEISWLKSYYRVSVWKPFILFIFYYSYSFLFFLFCTLTSGAIGNKSISY